VTWNWSLVAEVLGFVSACALLWPAVTQNAPLRSAAIMVQRLKGGRGRLGPLLAQTKSVQQANQPVWSPRDQWLLTVGSVLLLVSFGLKVAVLLHWLPA
jgi:hypothetical protein